MTKVYVVTAISSCDNEYAGDPIAMDDQFVLTDKGAADDKLAELYNERVGYDGKYGEVVNSYIDDTDFEVVLEDEDSTTTYSGKIREYDI